MCDPETNSSAGFGSQLLNPGFPPAISPCHQLITRTKGLPWHCLTMPWTDTHVLHDTDGQDGCENHPSLFKRLPAAMARYSPGLAGCILAVPLQSLGWSCKQAFEILFALHGWEGPNLSARGHRRGKHQLSADSTGPTLLSQASNPACQKA